MTKVFYSGMWDLLHIGHVRALKKAKSLGQYLCVGVVTDAFAQSYRDFIVQSFEERTEIVRALKCVDEVVCHRWWDDNTDFIIQEGFTIRVIGPQHGQQHQLQVEARQLLESKGVKYVVVPRTPNISTTIMKERVRQRYEEISCVCCSASTTGRCFVHALVPDQGGDEHPPCACEGTSCACGHPSR